MYRVALIALTIFATGLAAGADGIQYGIGRAATPQEIRAAGPSVPPDGSGLPPGHGTALEGQQVYQTRCVACHGTRGEGTDGFPALVGGKNSLATDKPVLTVGSYWPYATTLWDYINRAMPYPDAGSLTPNQVYSVTAYILFLNGIVGERVELNQKALPKVRMPNRDGFTGDARPDVPNSDTVESNVIKRCPVQETCT